MLYRFREQQAIDMGLGSRVKGERRPRMASSVTSLRECERWRGDILRDISRKVSKIQDSTLGDYEIRDLNDEINQLMREKRHYETQIVNLGGANYKRGNQMMTDDAGREVPGTRGYKYFGRAKDLPGVKEMFNKGAQQASEESARNASFQMFLNQGPDYYGDNEESAELLAEEDELARKEWEEQVAHTASTLSIQETPEIPYPIPQASSSTSVAPTAPAGETVTETGTKSKKTKRSKKDDADVDEEQANKKAKTSDDVVMDEADATPASSAPDTAAMHEAAMKATAATIAASYLGVLNVEHLQTPTLPDAQQMAQILLDVRKKALMEEYGV